jgi:thiamine-phosphate pyrophosphorylase
LRRTLCLVVDRACDRHPLVPTVAAVVEAGVDWVQLRDRALEGADWLSWAQDVAAAARGAEILVNRRVDVALAIAACGVHLGFDAISPAEAAALLPAGSRIGVSAHSPEEVRAAQAAGATYAHLAPVWDPLSKPRERPALGPGILAEACASGLPVLAQGGVSADRCAEVLGAGAAGVAVTGDLLLADDPVAATRALRAALDR